MSLRRFFRRNQWDTERAAELESYLQIETDRNVEAGMSARRRSRRCVPQAGKSRQDSRDHLRNEFHLLH